MTLPRMTRVLPLLLLSVTLAGCDLVGDVLEFGFWVIVIIALLIALVIWWIAKRIGGRRRPPGPPPPRA